MVDNKNKISEFRQLKNIILFDGVCNLCNSAVDFVIRRDRKSTFVFASLSETEVFTFLENEDENLLATDSILLVSNEKIYTKSSAAIRIAQKLGGLWPLLSVFLILPKFLRDVLYDWIAKNRYKWFGKRETCRLPSKEELERFIF